MTTGAEACRLAAMRLAAAGVPDAATDARILFLHAMGQAAGKTLARHQLAELLAAPMLPKAAPAFEAAITARANRQPVSQIIGRRAFWKHEFRVTRDVLDPRPETETLIAAALDLPWSRVLDLGTGSGAILVSLLAERPGASGVGVDISALALKLAQENAEMAGVSAEFLESDWYAGVAGRFDLITANPPYIALAEMDDLAPETREWEPFVALSDGGDGLAAYRVICAGAPAHLAAGGHLMVEIGHQQADAVAGLMRQAGFENPRILRDLDGRDRVLCATL